LRRNAPGEPAKLRETVGPLRVDPEAHRAYVDGVEVELTALEFRLLSTFMSRVGRVQTREQLLHDVWEMTGDVQTRTVDTHVKRLREKLGSGRDLLEAVPGAAALLEVGARIVARNGRMEQLLGGAPTVLEATRSDELVDLCARGLAGWPHQRELALPALGLQIQAQVTPLSHARALLVLRDLTAERRADQMRRDFIANASHELRTPVTAICGAAETLLHGGLELPEQARSFVEMIARHADRLTRLTDDLLDLSRLETGEWKAALGAVQLAPLAASVIDLFRERAAEKGIVLDADVPERLRANADRRALEQILVNLL